MSPPRARTALLGVQLAVLVAVLTSRVRDVASDPRATLVTAQVLLQHGTLALDSLGPDRIADYGTVLMPYGGHTYLAFPLGTSLLSLPFVAVANAFGLDMREYVNERLVQVLLVASISVVAVLLLARIARRWLSPGWAVSMAGLTWFGSAFASTQATALWSHDCATLIALAVLDRVIPKEGTRSHSAYVTGALLFVAYLCRPTMSLLALVVLPYVYFRDRKAATKTGLVLAVALALFVAASLYWLGAPLPPYYRAARLAGGHYGTALLGNLLSPSRGLFVFSPIFLVPLLLLKSTLAALRRDKPLLLIAVVWPVLHVLLISRFRHWWAGYSFGPRLCTDILPGLFVLLCMTLGVAFERYKRLAVALATTLGACSCFINTMQGLYSRAPKEWNKTPSIDEHPELVFDWRYPQFLHTAARQRARLAEWNDSRPR